MNYSIIFIVFMIGICTYLSFLFLGFSLRNKNLKAQKINED